MTSPETVPRLETKTLQASIVFAHTSSHMFKWPFLCVGRVVHLISLLLLARVPGSSRATTTAIFRLPRLRTIEMV